MYPAPFEYHRPDSVQMALKLLGDLGAEAKLCAGGQSLLPTMKLRLAKPEHLVDLGAIASLRGIRREDGMVVIGAMTTHFQVETSPEVRSVLPALAGMAGNIADPQVRNRGTIGGSLVHADPAADYAANMLAYEAELVCETLSGQRRIPIQDWFQGLMTTDLQENEILTEIHVPIPSGGRVGASYMKLPHPASRFALVGVAAIVILNNDNICRDIRVGITGVGSVPTRAAALEGMLRGKTLNNELISTASTRAADESDVQENLRITRQDHEQLCCVYAKRAVQKAFEVASAVPAKNSN
jgi:aerobic carbon-monoxide dehydrogenase medium subunit